MSATTSLDPYPRWRQKKVQWSPACSKFFFFFNDMILLNCAAGQTFQVLCIVETKNILEFLFDLCWASHKTDSNSAVRTVHTFIKIISDFDVSALTPNTWWGSQLQRTGGTRDRSSHVVISRQNRKLLFRCACARARKALIWCSTAFWEYFLEVSVNQNKCREISLVIYQKAKV